MLNGCNEKNKTITMFLLVKTMKVKN